MFGGNVIVQVVLVREGLVAELTGIALLAIQGPLGPVGVPAQDHLDHAAALPLVAAIVVTVNDPHVADIGLLVHQDLAALVAGEASAVPATQRSAQVTGQVGGCWPGSSGAGG